jgi:flagellar biosynthesis protein FlhG
MFMPDQAEVLRELVRARPGAVDARPTARSILFTSGKGGVGTSNLALNLAVALGDYGQRVVLVDADLGLANLDLLCGISPSCDLGEVLADGDRPLADAIMAGPNDVRIVAGAHGMRNLAEPFGDGADRIAAELDSLELECDFLLIDAGSGLNPSIATLAAASEQVVLVTTPEPTSVADAHAALNRLRRELEAPRLRAVVTQAASAAEGKDCLARLCQSSRQFLGLVVTPLGTVRFDPAVRRAVRNRKPFVCEAPHGLAARGVRRLARTLIAERQPRVSHRGFFAALTARWSLGKVAR